MGEKGGEFRRQKLHLQKGKAVVSNIKTFNFIFYVLFMIKILYDTWSNKANSFVWVWQRASNDTQVQIKNKENRQL